MPVFYEWKHEIEATTAATEGRTIENVLSNWVDRHIRIDYCKENLINYVAFYLQAGYRSISIQKIFTRPFYKNIKTQIFSGPTSILLYKYICKTVKQLISLFL